MIDPLERFEAEHEDALAELNSLEAAALALDAGPSDEHFEMIRRVHGALAGAVREHNENEELALFPLLGEAAPTEPFVEDHVALRTLERELIDAVERRDADEAASLSLTIVEKLRDHIERENTVLFPMAREILGAEGLQEVARRLEV
jgi:hemerythrin-like domain-containing protein